MATIKIAIAGIGAVGGYYGGMLARYYKNSPEVEISFISRGENLKIIREKGLLIKSGSESFVTKPKIITEDPEEIGKVDFLFCCTKSYDLKESLTKLIPLMDRETILVPFLNGANITEQIQTLFPDQPVWKGCVYIGSRLIAPGVIDKYAVKERLFFGSETGDKEKQELLLKLLSAAGINAFCPEDITHRIWKKFFMISTAATITSYYDKPIDKVLAENYDTFLQLCGELKQVALAVGIRLEDDIIETTLHTQKMMPPGSITSMHHDFRQGKRTELEVLTGYVVREAEKAGISVPAYQAMYKKLAGTSGADAVL